MGYGREPSKQAKMIARVLQKVLVFFFIWEEARKPGRGGGLRAEGDDRGIIDHPHLHSSPRTTQWREQQALSTLSF